MQMETFVRHVGLVSAIVHVVTRPSFAIVWTAAVKARNAILYVSLAVGYAHVLQNTSPKPEMLTSTDSSDMVDDGPSCDGHAQTNVLPVLENAIHHPTQTPRSSSFVSVCVAS